MRDNLFRIGTAAIVGSLLFVTTACGGDDDDKKSEAKTTTEATPTTPATSPAEAKSPAGGAGSVTPLTQAQLEAAVLKAEEMPQGTYAAQRDEADGETATPAECQPLLDLGSPLNGTPKPTADATASVTFGTPDAMQVVMVEAYSFAPGDAETVLAKGREAPAKCASVTALDSEGESGVTAYAEVQHAKVGDDSLAIGVTPEGGGALGVVVVRSGSTLFSVSKAEMAGTSPALPDDDALVNKQLEKLVAAAK